MKSEIFTTAISNRQKIRFLYGLSREIVLEPYMISVNNNGNKVIYGRVDKTNVIKMFRYDNIFNIRRLSWNRFSPIIPILPQVN